MNQSKITAERLLRKAIVYIVRPAAKKKLACSAGDSPAGVRVRSPVAWVVSVEETKRMKPTDKAALGAVSESPGRNESEPIGGLDTI